MHYSYQKKTRALLRFMQNNLLMGMILCCVFCMFCGVSLSSAQAGTGDITVEEQKQDTVLGVQQEVKGVEIETAAIKKEAEVQKKAVELEKKKAEVKLKEAQVAKKEAQVVKETAQSKDEIKKALKRAQEKEKEAVAAQQRVTIAEAKMLAAQEKAGLAEEELRIAQERAAIAEEKIKSQNTLYYNQLLQTALIFVVGYLLIFLFVSVINRRVKDMKVRHVARKNVVYLLNFVIIVLVAYVWIHNISSITIFLSFVGAGLALALQEVILSIAGWVLILIRKPFEVGDRIELGGIKGDVIDIRLFQTSMLEIGNWVDADQSTGRIVNVPNAAIFKKENFNYNRGFEFIWNEIALIVTFESDWKRGKEIMTHHAKRIAEGMDEVVKREISHMSRRYMIYYEKLTPIVYVDIKDSGVQLTLRYLTEARKRRVTHDELCRSILDDFEKEEKVNFAYTTYRIVK